MLKKYGHLFPIVFVMIPALIYLVYQSYLVTSRKINIKDITDPSFYFTSVAISPEIQKLADSLPTLQATLDYVTQIPYKVHNFRARDPLQTIQRNYGDCDDKSNLLSSLLAAKGYENYIVLVPKHAFVIVNADQEISDAKALHFHGKKYYILESTAIGSKVGYPLKYPIHDIQAVIDPINQNMLKIDKITYH